MKDLRNFLTLDDDLNQKVEVIKNKVISNKHLQNYCKKHNIVLSEAKISNSLMNLIHFTDYYNKCETCAGLEECKQFIQGYKPVLIDLPTHIHLQYIPCDLQKAYITQVEVTNNLHSFYMPKKMMEANLNDIDIGESRNKAVSKIATFAKSYTPDKFQKAAYLTGPFGIGKTYLLAAMANALAKRNIQVALVYLPDMMRELKSAIGRNEFENLVNKIKQMQVLILDDIGSEMNTQWSRDEIIGPILQFRMLEELPTFFSSNKSINELTRDYATTNDQVQDQTKAKRIKDRILALADEYVMSGKNYRY